MRASDRSSTRAAALADLRREFGARGYGRKATGRILFELGLHLVLALGGLAVFCTFASAPVRLCGLIVSTAGSIGVGTNTHTSSHYATSDRRWVNELLAFFGYPFFLGLSASFWWRKHVVVHHPAPNVIGVDEDADLTPWLAMTDQDIDAARGALRFYYARLQWVLLPLILAANGFSMQRSGWVYLIGCLQDGGRRKAVHWIDLGCLLLHLAVNLGVPLLFVAPATVLLVYALRITLLGYAMFAMLAPGHLPAEAARVRVDHKQADFLLLQTATTVNFYTGPIGRLICSGLEYQIEHHLFPHVSHVHYPAMSGRVRDLCRMHGLPYRSYSWDVALWKSWQIFRRPGRIDPHLEGEGFHS